MTIYQCLDCHQSLDLKHEPDECNVCNGRNFKTDPDNLETFTAYLLNPYSAEISAVQLAKHRSFETAYELMGCQTIDVHQLSEGIDLLSDEECWLSPRMAAVLLRPENAEAIFFGGKAIIAGFNAATGETIAPNITIEDAAKLVTAAQANIYPNINTANVTESDDGVLIDQKLTLEAAIMEVDFKVSA